MPSHASSRLTTKETLRIAHALVVLASVALGLTVSPWALAVGAFVGLALMQSAFSKWCPLERALVRLGMPYECSNGRPTDADMSLPSTTKDIIRLVAGTMILASMLLGALVNPWWLALSAFVGLNLLQSAFSRWCLLESLLTRAGVPGACQQGSSA